MTILKVNCFTCGEEVTVNILAGPGKPCPKCGGRMDVPLSKADQESAHDAAAQAEADRIDRAYERISQQILREW